MAVASQYGFRYKMQSKGVIKSAKFGCHLQRQSPWSGTQPLEAQFYNFWNHVFVCKVSGVENIGQCGRLSQLSWLLGAL